MKKPQLTTFVPTVVSRIQNYGQRIREIELTLPESIVITDEFVLPPEYHYFYGHAFPVVQKHRPGNSFLARPFGTATNKIENRLYTVSDCSNDTVLATVIDRTKNNPNTSAWWLSDNFSRGTIVFCKATFDVLNCCFVIHEHRTKGDASVELYPDGEWEKLRVIAVGLSTGIAPFLAHIQYFDERNFGQSNDTLGIDYTFIMSVQHPEELVWYNSLNDLAKIKPLNFTFHPMLTQTWSDAWPENQRRRITARRIADLVPKIEQCELWYCGGTAGIVDLKQGMQEANITMRRVRAEVFD